MLTEQRIEAIKIAKELTSDLNSAEIIGAFMIAVIELLESKNVATFEEIETLVNDVKAMTK
ncbi:hypothetical protein [Lysinibacillus fusiformis]|uniref:hypothetical protein n=1 Tax=Lysinibacillus fusiformis TaxID=28031 RepID=UPI003AAE1813